MIFVYSFKWKESTNFQLMTLNTHSFRKVFVFMLFYEYIIPTIGAIKIDRNSFMILRSIIIMINFIKKILIIIAIKVVLLGIQLLSIFFWLLIRLLLLVNQCLNFILVHFLHWFEFAFVRFLHWFRHEKHTLNLIWMFLFNLLFLLFELL